jgi:hypothetical protein
MEKVYSRKFEIFSVLPFFADTVLSSGPVSLIVGT